MRGKRQNFATGLATLPTGQQHPQSADCLKNSVDLLIDATDSTPIHVVCTSDMVQALSNMLLDICLTPLGVLPSCLRCIVGCIGMLPSCLCYIVSCIGAPLGRCAA